MPVAPLSSTQTYVADKLIAGDYPRVTATVTIASGANLTRGALLGRITSGGKYTLSLAAASDGSQTPVAVLADDAAAAAADVLAPIYFTGQFNSDAVTFGTGWTAATAAPTLRDAGIFFTTALPSDPV